MTTVLREINDRQKRIIKALSIASQYGAIEGDHHRAWVIDQMVRSLTGSLDEYEVWVEIQRNGEDGPDTYAWDEGIAP